MAGGSAPRVPTRVSALASSPGTRRAKPRGPRKSRKGPKCPLANESAGLTPETVAAVAQSLEVSQRDVVEMDRRLAGDLSLNAPVNSDAGVVEWADTLVDETPNAETIVAEYDESTRQESALHAALDVLTERERKVFEGVV